MSKASEESIRCSFCGREKKEVNVLIAGITGHICDSCISQAQFHREWPLALLTQPQPSTTQLAPAARPGLHNTGVLRQANLHARRRRRAPATGASREAKTSRRPRARP